MAEEIGLFEAMYTQRAMRYLKPDPVPDELIKKVLDAGIRAPNGGNIQRWAFIVIKDPEIRRKIGEYYRQTPRPIVGPETAPSQLRHAAATDHLTEHLSEVPVFILACVRRDGFPNDINLGASIFPAVQNMLLAARGLGLGGVLTTRQRAFQKEIKEMLAIPDDVETAALIPLGFPAEGRRYGPATRRPVEEVTFYDRWGVKG